MKKFWKRLNFNEICGEMRRTFVQVFKHFDGNFVLFLRQFLEKLVKNCGKNMQLYRYRSQRKVSLLVPSLNQIFIHFRNNCYSDKWRISRSHSRIEVLSRQKTYGWQHSALTTITKLTENLRMAVPHADCDYPSKHIQVTGSVGVVQPLHFSCMQQQRLLVILLNAGNNILGFYLLYRFIIQSLKYQNCSYKCFQYSVFIIIEDLMLKTTSVQTTSFH